MDGCNVGGAGIIIAFVTAYSVHFISPMITASAECLKCKYVCVCVRAGRLFLLPCQHSPFPPFSISSAFSLAISDWLFIDSTLYATSHAIQVELGLRRGGDGRGEAGVHMIPEDSTSLYPLCMWQLLSPEAQAPSLWNLHKHHKDRKPVKSVVSFYINAPRNVLFLIDRQETEQPTVLHRCCISKSSEDE